MQFVFSFVAAPWIPSRYRFLIGAILISAAVGGTSRAAGALSLSWTDGSPDEQGFRIERAVGSGAFVVLTTVPANTTSYLDSNLAPGDYYYRVCAFNAGSTSSFTDTVKGSVAALALPTISVQPASQTVIVGSSVTFTAVSNAGAATFSWRKDGVIIAGAVGAAYTISTVTAADAGQYTVQILNGAGSVISAAAVLTVTPAATGPLSGKAISSVPWNNDPRYTASNVFDGDTGTFFTGRTTDAFVYVGLDLGVGTVVNRIRFFPRSTLSWRMNGGRFRGANSADLSDATTLYTVPSTPPEGVWQDISLPSSTSTYRYVFFTTASANEADVAEIQLFGPAQAPAQPVAPTSSVIAGTPIGSAPWNNVQAYSAAKVFDNDPSTFFTGNTSDAFVFVGLDFGASKTVDRVRFYPRPTLSWRMNGGRFRGANKADLSDAVTLYTIPSTPPEGIWQDVTLPTTTASYRYVFYTTASVNEADVAEIQFIEKGGAVAAPIVPVGLLSGAPISSGAWHNDQTYAATKVFDNSTSTFFAGDNAHPFVYVGLDFGDAKIIDHISFFPRATLNARMNGGRFRGANRADLTDAVTLYTIPSTPPDGVWQDVTLPSSTAAYRYVFYTTTSNNGADVAEIDVFGH